MLNILPVILSGGSGTRLWPASRSMYPKQLLPLVDGVTTMLQATAQRLKGMADTSGDCMVVCNVAHRFLVAEQLRAIDKSAQIVLEPEGRNTAPAVALAAFLAAENDPDTTLLVMPADHVIEDTQAFQAAVGSGREAAADGSRGVGKRADDRGLCTELGLEAGDGLAGGNRQDFKSYAASERDLRRLIDDTHAAPTNLADDSKIAEDICRMWRA